MIEVSQQVWLRNIQPADIGLILADNFFSTVQNWLRRAEKNPLRASHSFMVVSSPRIIEANGMFVSYADIIKNIGGKTECWIFRYKNITQDQANIMLAFADGMVESNGQYGVEQIRDYAWEFVYRIFKGKAPVAKDRPGVICSELTGKAILKAGLPYIQDEIAATVTPSEQRSWFVDCGLALGIDLAAYYDGEGKFFILENLSKN